MCLRALQCLNVPYSTPSIKVLISLPLVTKNKSDTFLNPAVRVSKETKMKGRNEVKAAYKGKTHRAIMK